MFSATMSARTNITWLCLEDYFSIPTTLLCDANSPFLHDSYRKRDKAVDDREPAQQPAREW